MGKKEIYNEIRMLAISLGETITNERVSIYTEILSRYEENAAVEAIRKCSLEMKFFPKPVEIIQLITPKIDQADIEFLVGEIIKSIRTYGWSRGDEAQKNLGPKAWEAINKIGGWVTMCETPQEDLHVLRAQLRGACLASLNEKEIKHKLEQIELRENKLISSNKIFKGLLDDK